MANMASKASAHDVAAYILEKCGKMTAMKLQKMVYYAQAWSLVWDERPLFTERIEAWANGPVIPKLYYKHQGVFEVSTWDTGEPGNLDNDAKDTVEAIVSHYGAMKAQELSDLTHSEQPWLNARVGLTAGERGSKEITHAAMAEYYGSLLPDG